jgi:23S rRNA pseudouridine955/2504/2580 synthase
VKSAFANVDSTKSISTNAASTKSFSTNSVSANSVSTEVVSSISAYSKTVSYNTGPGTDREDLASIREGSGNGCGNFTNTKFGSETGQDIFLRRGLEILYEDDDIALFVKPAGMLSQPGNGSELSAADLIPDILLSSGSLREEDLRAFHPAPLNRLDRNTSGILLCGLSMKGAQTISRLIRSGEMKKEYLAIVQGTDLQDGTYSVYAVKDPKHNRMLLSKQPSKNAVDMVTEFHVLGVSDGFSLVKATLITGRTHQIRAQLSWLGFPVAGDRKYGDGSARSGCMPKLDRQMLHAFRVTFPENTDPCPGISGRIFTADVPEDFRRIATALDLKEALNHALTS